MEAKRILFIIPPYFNYSQDEDEIITEQKPVFTIPYGVLSIAAYIKRNCNKCIEVSVLDLNIVMQELINNQNDVLKGLNECVKNKIKNFKPDYIGVSALFNTQYNYLEMIASSIFAVRNETFVFLGGGLGTNLYKDVLDNYNCIDAICYGEGEIPIKELIDAENTYAHIAQSPSWITREKIRYDFKFEYKFVENLDNIPIFDYSLIDFEKYGGRSADKRDGMDHIEMSIHTSRGCPFNCVFCSNSTVHGKKIRYMSVDKVIEEIEFMIKAHNISVVLIEDDHFLSNKIRAKAILESLIKFNIRIEFPNGVAVYAIDSEIATLMKKAGATTVSLAIESGSQYVLTNIIDKPLEIGMIYNAVARLKENSIAIHAFIVIGLPGELEKHREETMDMLHELEIDWVHFFIATPIAGSRLYDICKKEGFLIDGNDFKSYTVNKCNILTPEINPHDIERKAYTMNLKANFIDNYYFRVGEYEKVLPYFVHVASRYPEHGIVHYCLAEIYKKTNDKELSIFHKKQYTKILKNNKIWRSYFQELSIGEEIYMEDKLHGHNI